MPKRSTADAGLLIDPYHLDRDGLIFEERRARQSSIGDWGICEERLGFKWRNPEEYRTSSSPVLGTGYHAGLALSYQTFKDEGRWATRAAMHDAVRDAINNEVAEATHFQWNGMTQREIDELACACVDAYFDGEHFWNPDVFEIIGVEVEGLLPRTHLEGLPETWTITIQLDLVLGEPVSGRHLLVDHKTSRRKWADTKRLPHKTLQPSWYLPWWVMLWTIHCGEIIDAAFYFDVMQHQGFKFNRYPAPVTPHSVQVARDVAVQYANALESGRPLTVSPEHTLCDARWCDYFNECRGGAALRDVSVTF